MSSEIKACPHGIEEGGMCSTCELAKQVAEVERQKKLPAHIPNPFPIEIIDYARGNNMITFGEGPDKDGETIRIWGRRKRAKSAFGEACCIRVKQAGGSIYDLLGADDDEDLVWLESEYRDDVILIVDDSAIMPPPYDKMSVKISEFFPEVAPDNKVFVMSKRFFPNETAYYQALITLIGDSFSKHGFLQRNKYRTTHVLFFREVAQFLKSQMRTRKAKNSREAEENFIDFHNQALHHGISLVMDSQRNIDVHKSLREQSDWTVVKCIGEMSWPKDKDYVMSMVDPTFLRTMQLHTFLLIGSDETVAIGAFDEPPFHLVRGGDDKNPPILERLGLTNIEFEEKKVAEEESQNRVGDRRVKVTPEIHKMMIKLHNTPNGKRETTSAMIIGLKLGFNEGTVKKEITRHQLNECVCED